MRARTSSIEAGLALGVIMGGACLIAQGPLPGDVAATRLLQAAFGDDPVWARLLTRSAHAPWLWPTLLVAVGLAFLRGGRWTALVPPFGWIIVLVVDRGLRALVFAPRPAASLVEVASVGEGSGLPSTFALVYGVTFGAVLLARARREERSRMEGTLAVVVAAAVLMAGCAGRIVLGGHWPSQVLASLALAFTIVLSLQVAIDAARTRRDEWYE